MKRLILKIYSSTDIEDKKMRFNISSYLDHLETLAYFVNKEYISKLDFDNLLDGMVKYHFELFEEWIKQARNTDPNAYIELLKLFGRLPKV
jgi:hypothetical protein